MLCNAHTQLFTIVNANTVLCVSDDQTHINQCPKWYLPIRQFV